MTLDLLDGVVLSLTVLFLLYLSHSMGKGKGIEVGRKSLLDNSLPLTGRDYEEMDPASVDPDEDISGDHVILCPVCHAKWKFSARVLLSFMHPDAGHRSVEEALCKGATSEDPEGCGAFLTTAIRASRLYKVLVAREERMAEQKEQQDALESARREVRKKETST